MSEYDSAQIDELIINVGISEDDRVLNENLSLLLSTCHRVGLAGYQLTSLVDLALSQAFDTRQSETLIKCMIPRDSVPWAAIIRAISWICTGNVPKRIEKKILQWIIAVYQYIDDYRSISALYDVLLHYLDSYNMSQYVSHLLFLLTRKEDVKTYRCTKIIRAYNKMGSPVHLVGLLLLYKQYSPELVTIPLKTHKVYFAPVEQLWISSTNKLARVSKNRRYDGVVENNLEDHWLEEPQPIKKLKLDQKKGLKKMKKEETQISLNISLHSTTFNELLNSVDCIQFPRPICTIFEIPCFLQFIPLSYKQDVPHRLAMWLQYALIDKLVRNSQEKPNEETTIMLTNVINFNEYMQEPLLTTNVFLKHFLPTWNGEDYLVQILNLVSWSSVCPFDEFEESIIAPLRQLFYKSSYMMKVLILQTFTELLDKLAAMEMKRKTSPEQVFMFPRDTSNFSPLVTIVKFISSVHELCENSLAVDWDHCALMHAVMSFYELIPDLHLKYGLPILELPPDDVIYRALLSCNMFGIWRLCALIIKYKKAFLLMRLQLNKEIDSESLLQASLVQIRGFNSYILTMCDALWRNRTFMPKPSPQSPKSLKYTSLFSSFSDVAHVNQIPHANELLSLQYHVAFIGFALNFLKTSGNEEKTGVIRWLFHKPAVRQSYLEYLQTRGCQSITKFIEEFMNRVSS